MSGYHPALRDRVEDLLGQMVPGRVPGTTDRLTFFLTVADRPAGDPGDGAPPIETKALVQFVNVSCSQEGDWSVFRTKDGSFLRADTRAGRAWGRVSGALLDGIPYPLTDLVMASLMEMLKERGLYGLHAAAITREGRGYLFPGDAASGKTTVALGLLRKGSGYLADDKVLLRRDEQGIMALAFTRRFNIDPILARFYPEISPLANHSPLPRTAKRPFDVSMLYPGTFMPECRPSAVIHIRSAAGRTSRLSTLSPAESFVRLARQTILSARRECAAMQLRLLGDLVSRVDNYLLDNARDSGGSPDEMLELVSRL